MSAKDGTDWVYYSVMVTIAVTSAPWVVIIMWCVSLLFHGEQPDRFLASHVFPFTLRMIRLWHCALRIIMFWKRP